MRTRTPVPSSPPAQGRTAPPLKRPKDSHAPRRGAPAAQPLLPCVVVPADLQCRHGQQLLPWGRSIACVSCRMRLHVADRAVAK